MDEDEEIEQQLLYMFEDNFQRLRTESGHTLSGNVKEVAKQQVLLYWKKLKEVARSVTDTEVSLNLPNQITGMGRKYNIEGVVDIVREEKGTIMYDIKTHEANFVKSHTDIYQRQLNVYAYIWERLKNEEISSIAVIATRIPKSLSKAIDTGDMNAIDQEMNRWDPVINLALDDKTVRKTITQFSETVDRIEEHKFEPPTEDVLSTKQHTGNTFATDICGNCDARFTCESYRRYASKGNNQSWSKFMSFYNDDESDEGKINEQIEESIENENHLKEVLGDLS